MCYTLFNNLNIKINCGLVCEEPKKDYEILSWYFGDMNITKNPDGTARRYFIHSVLRESDGEVFTIGDETNKGIITEILLHPVIDVFGIKTDLHDCWNSGETLKK